MKGTQFLSGGLAIAFAAAFITVCLRDNPSAVVVMPLGVLSVFALLVTVVDLGRFANISVDVGKGKITASQETVELTLQANTDQEKIERKDSGEAAPSLTPLAIEAQHKGSAERTDADYLSLATDAWRAKKFDDALKFAYAGLDRPASDPRITAALYSRLGAIERALGQSERAERHYHRAIEIDPNFSSAHNNLGAILYITGKPVEAEAAYREAIRLDPENVTAQNNLELLLKLKKK